MIGFLLSFILIAPAIAAPVKIFNYERIAVQCLKNADIGSAADVICWNHRPKEINPKFKNLLAKRPHLFFKRASSKPVHLPASTEQRPPGFFGAVIAKRDIFECFEVQFANGKQDVSCRSLESFSAADSFDPQPEIGPQDSEAAIAEGTAGPAESPSHDTAAHPSSTTR